MEIASTRLDALFDLEVALPESGTVAANVHWILLPLTLPLTLFTFSWREISDDKEDSEFSMLYDNNKCFLL